MSKKKDRPTGPFAALEAVKKKLEEEERAREAAKKAGKPAPPRPAAKPAKPPKGPGTIEELSQEDAMSFHRLMSGVVPLDRSQGSRIPKTETAAPSPGAKIAAKRVNARSLAEEEAAQVHEHLRSLVEGKTRFEVEDDGTRVEGRRVDVPPDVLRKLRRGVMPVDAKLDLHGMDAGDAREALAAFLKEKRARGERCVLVVHGKGEHSPRGQGVLRGEISAWLSQSAASEHVAAFATASDADGGEGAVYVLLRR